MDAFKLTSNLETHQHWHDLRANISMMHSWCHWAEDVLGGDPALCPMHFFGRVGEAVDACDKIIRLASALERSKHFAAVVDRMKRPDVEDAQLREWVKKEFGLVEKPVVLEEKELELP